MSQDEQALLNAVRKSLDEGSEQLDPRLLARLRQARRAAVEAVPRPRRQTWRWVVGAAATLALVVGVVVQMERATAPSVAYEDMALLTEGVELDIYQDLEFYQWLAGSEQNV